MLEPIPNHHDTSDLTSSPSPSFTLLQPSDTDMPGTCPTEDLSTRCPASWVLFSSLQPHGSLPHLLPISVQCHPLTETILSPDLKLQPSCHHRPSTLPPYSWIPKEPPGPHPSSMAFLGQCTKFNHDPHPRRISLVTAPALMVDWCFRGAPDALLAVEWENGTKEHKSREKDAALYSVKGQSPGLVQEAGRGSKGWPALAGINVSLAQGCCRNTWGGRCSPALSSSQAAGKRLGLW